MNKEIEELNKWLKCELDKLPKSKNIVLDSGKLPEDYKRIETEYKIKLKKIKEKYKIN